MARKKKTTDPVMPVVTAEITEQPITETIEKNYMPYVMSVIISRAIPEIDGFKPSHRKLLYTMYKMGLLTGPRSKSANVVGATMRLNPHGDAAIYETMVRLTKGNEALLHPFVDSKGSFGKQYSSEMAYAASRYTEVKLDPFCNELFGGIDCDAVDFIPNYDNTTTEPVLLPTSFPNILVSPNLGIAVGMASEICSFNLGEICDGTIALLKKPDTTAEELLDIIKAPDFPGGAHLIYERDKMLKIYETGYGKVMLRARYAYNKSDNTIDILQIPYSSTIESIMGKITDLVKAGKLKEISDFRDAIDLNGFKLTIDLRRGVDPEKLMAKLFRLTPLQNSFSCNFNLLVNGTPKLLGVKDILCEWIIFRMGCVRRQLNFELKKKEDKLHLLLGLAAILLDIDKAVRIVRTTERESEVVPNLMQAFSIDEVQAEYIAEIKLRHLNREYILNRVEEIKDLQAAIEEIKSILADELKLKAKIASQLAEIKAKYAKPRKTQLIYADDVEEIEEEDLVENYNVRAVLTRDGYFKKNTMLSLRANDDQKLKEGDSIVYSEDTDNRAEIIFFTDKAQVYKAKLSDFDDMKASELGDFLPAKLNMDDGERPVMAKVLHTYDPKHNVIFIFENGKGVRIPINVYETKTNRKKLTSAFHSGSPVVGIFYEEAPKEILLVNNLNKAILINSKLIPLKTTRTSSGATLFTLKAGKQKITSATDDLSKYQAPEKCRKKKIPATGILLDDFNIEVQQMKI